MSRWGRIAVCLVLLLAVLAVAVSATDTDTLYRQQADASGAADLPGQLPEQTQALLQELDLDSLTPDAYANLDVWRVSELLSTLFVEQSQSPLRTVGLLLGVVLTAALLAGLEDAALDGSLRQTFHSITVLGAGGVLLPPLFALFQTVGQTVEQVTVFLAAYVPVYGAIVATGGRGAGAVSYQATLLGASQLLAWLVQEGIYPLLTVSLAFGCAGSVAEGFCLDAFSQTLHKLILWFFGLFSTLFSGVLSLQQLAASAGDTLGGRVVRFSLSSFVPVVGGLLSEAYTTVAGCTGILTSAVGCFGLASVVLVVLPPLCTCLSWNLGLHLAGSVAALFRLGAIQRLCLTVAGAVRVLIALLAVFALLMVVSTAVVALTAGR